MFYGMHPVTPLTERRLRRLIVLLRIRTRFASEPDLFENSCALESQQKILFEKYY